jgi:hypothetical protein
MGGAIAALFTGKAQAVPASVIVNGRLYTRECRAPLNFSRCNYDGPTFEDCKARFPDNPPMGIVNVFEPKVSGDYLSTRDGEQLILKAMRRMGRA